LSAILSEGAVGRWRSGKPELTRDCQALRGTLGVKVIICKPADPEAKGLLERAHDYLEGSFLPGRVFTGPADFNDQLLLQGLAFSLGGARTPQPAAGPAKTWTPPSAGSSAGVDDRTEQLTGTGRAFREADRRGMAGAGMFGESRARASQAQRQSHWRSTMSGLMLIADLVAVMAGLAGIRVPFSQTGQTARRLAGTGRTSSGVRRGVMMTTEQPEGLATDGVGSLEMRWIIAGRLDIAVSRWFARFPAATESREDSYLLHPYLPGLAVKVRAAGALEVKVYLGSPGIADVAERARGRIESWRKWSFPCAPPGHRHGDPAGWMPIRKSRRISQFSLASGNAGSDLPGPGKEPGARWSSRRSLPLARPGGHSGSRRPGR
jgi:hypothetical protein